MDAAVIFAVTLALRTLSGVTPGLDGMKKFVTRARSRASPAVAAGVVDCVGVVAGVVAGAALESVLASTAGESIGELLTSTHPVDIMIPANPVITRSLRDPRPPA